jgi:hypothetical protein
MIRALATLAGLACAAALLLLVPDTGSGEGGDLWQRAALIGFAGFVAGAFYQLGGIRRPGVRVNLPMLLAAFLPWTLLTLAICAQRAGTPVWLSDLAHDVLPKGALTRWSLTFPILVFVDGLLLSFALVEPRIGEVAQVPVLEDTETVVVPARPMAVADPAPEPVDLSS